MSDRTHTHTNDHSHGHAHGHNHGDPHSHEPGNGRDYSQAHPSGANADGDTWDGDKYTEFPGLQEIALASAAGVQCALSQSPSPSTAEGGLSCLEIGCGGGAVTPHLAPLFTTIHAIDTSPSMLRTFARSPAASIPGVTWSQHALSPSSAVEFDSRAKRFDVAVTNLVLHHVDDIPGFLAGARGLLKPGGRLVITEFGRDPDATAEGEGEGQVIEHKVTAEGSVNAAHHHHAAWTPREMVRLLEQNGFVDCHAEIRGKLPVISVPSLVAWGRAPA